MEVKYYKIRIKMVSMLAAAIRIIHTGWNYEGEIQGHGEENGT